MPSTSHPRGAAASTPTGGGGSGMPGILEDALLRDSEEASPGGGGGGDGRGAAAAAVAAHNGHTEAHTQTKSLAIFDIGSRSTMDVHGMVERIMVM